MVQLFLVIGLKKAKMADVADKEGTVRHILAYIVNQSTGLTQSTYQTLLFCSGRAHMSIVANPGCRADRYQFMSGLCLTSLLGFFT